MERLHSEGYKDLSPDKYTFNIVMKVSAWRDKHFRFWLQLHFHHTLVNCQALANCGERGAAHKANQLLQRMEASFANGDSSLKPDLLSYNTVLDAFSKEGDAKSADRLLEQMLGKGDDTIRPDAYSYTAVCLRYNIVLHQ
jgi:pentatricopeptide repeat protein